MKRLQVKKDNINWFSSIIMSFCMIRLAGMSKPNIIPSMAAIRSLNKCEVKLCLKLKI